jgi:hypothetical protein
MTGRRTSWLAGGVARGRCPDAYSLTKPRPTLLLDWGYTRDAPRRPGDVMSRRRFPTTQEDTPVQQGRDEDIWAI